METETKHAKLHEFVTSLNLQYTAEFVPMSKARSLANDKNSPGLNWNITIKRGRSSLTTTYFQGIAHVVGHKQRFGSRTIADQEYEDLILKTCETGLLYKRPNNLFQSTSGKQPAPLLLDILYSLVQDSDVLDSGGFEEWAGNYGYDTDSRKAETIYRACLEIGLKFRSLIGDENLSKLRELYSDY